MEDSSEIIFHFIHDHKVCYSYFVIKKKKPKKKPYLPHIVTMFLQYFNPFHEKDNLKWNRHSFQIQEI